MRLIENPNANALLEMMLFVPLALLLLFAGLDGALLYNARGAARSAIRDGLNSEQLVTQQQSILYGDLEDPELDIQRAQLLLDDVLLRIKSNLNNINKFSLDETQVKVLGKIYLLDIDPDTGQFCGIRSANITGSIPRDTSFDVSTALPNFRFRSLERLEQENFAVASSVHFLAQHVPLVQNQQRRFVPYAVAIGVEVTAIAGGISPGVTKWILGSFYGIGESIIVPLRLSIN